MNNFGDYCKRINEQCFENHLEYLNSANTFIDGMSSADFFRKAINYNSESKKPEFKGKIFEKGIVRGIEQAKDIETDNVTIVSGLCLCAPDQFHIVDTFPTYQQINDMVCIKELCREFEDAGIKANARFYVPSFEYLKGIYFGELDEVAEMNMRFYLRNLHKVVNKIIPESKIVEGNERLEGIKNEIVKFAQPKLDYTLETNFMKLKYPSSHRKKRDWDIHDASTFAFTINDSENVLIATDLTELSAAQLAISYFKENGNNNVKYIPVKYAPAIGRPKGKKKDEKDATLFRSFNGGEKIIGIYESEESIQKKVGRVERDYAAKLLCASPLFDIKETESLFAENPSYILRKFVDKSNTILERA